MNKKILISVIVPVYNVERYIEDTLNCILHQTFTDWEAIFVDDCSTDGSYNIIKKYEKIDKRIKVIRNKYNLGPSKTRNIAIKKSKGVYVAFLDSDDIWNENKLMLQYEFMKNNQYEFSFTSYDLIKDDGTSLLKEVHVPKRIDYDTLLKNTIISTITVMISSEYKDILLMPENISNGEDMATWLKLLKHIKYAYGLDVILSSYRQVDDSLSSGFLNKLTRMWFVYRDIENLSLSKSAKYYLFYIVNLIKKRRIKNNE